MNKKSLLFSVFPIFRGVVAATVVLLATGNNAFACESACPRSVRNTECQAPPPGESEPLLDLVEVMPKFRRGDVIAFRSWVMGRVRLPDDARDFQGGRVMVTFVVEADGSVAGIEVLSAPTPSMGAEVVRVVAQSPKWTPGTRAGEPVRVRMNLPIDFF